MYNAPKYEAGQIIDIRFSSQTMPDRIFINMVYKKPNSPEWMYYVLSERKSDYIYMSESQISKYESKKTSKAYDHNIVKEMYASGYRFCGNSKSDTCRNRADKLLNANYIKHIVLRSAVDDNGNIMPDNLGLWVQYRTVIDEGYYDISDDYMQLK